MKSVGDDVITFLKNATTKLEELQVKTEIGKAEMAEKLEEIKKSARKTINQMKATISASIDDKKESYQHLKAKIEQLEMQLALSKAETIEGLREQKEKISKSIKEVKEILAKD